MKQIEPNDSAPGNYFALPRLVRRRPMRTEDNWLEAWVMSVFVFIINYLFAVQLLAPPRASWMFFPALVLLLFVVWIFWLVVLYLNSWIAKLCWRFGLFNELPIHRIQSVLFGIMTSVFAAELMVASSWVFWIGVAWMAAVALNFSAALVLALNDEQS